MKSRYPNIKFDMLQMYFGEPYVIDLEGVKGSVTVYQPTIGDIVRMGEEKFYNMLNIFITNTTKYRLPLWESGLDWNKTSNFELFIMLLNNLDSEAAKLIFHDIDFSKFEIFASQNSEKAEIVLYNKEQDIEINENVYNHISQYLRTVFGIFPEEKYTEDNLLKEWFIKKDRRQIEIDKEKEEKGMLKHASSMQAVISACINHAGFKYNLKELKEVGVCQFYDSVKRLQIYEQSTACMKGLFSGFVDGSKINPEDYNFMREM